MIHGSTKVTLSCLSKKKKKKKINKGHRLQNKNISPLPFPFALVVEMLNKLITRVVEENDLEQETCRAKGSHFNLNFFFF